MRNPYIYEVVFLNKEDVILVFEDKSQIKTDYNTYCKCVNTIMTERKSDVIAILSLTAKKSA